MATHRHDYRGSAYPCLGVKDETAVYAMALPDRFLAVNLKCNFRAGIDSSSDSEIWGKSNCCAIASFRLVLATKFKEICTPCIGDLVRVGLPTWPEKMILQCMPRGGALFDRLGSARHHVFAFLCSHPRIASGDALTSPTGTFSLRDRR